MLRTILCQSRRIIQYRAISATSKPTTVSADDPAAIPGESNEEYLSTKYIIPKPQRQPNEPKSTKVRRLTWMSRKRGILETDLLLSTFAEKYLKDLDDAELVQYDLLLEENDWDIYYWVTNARPVPEHWAKSPVMVKLTKHARNDERVMLRMPEL